MADLSVVKKEIISLINIYPAGIATDKFNMKYENFVSRPNFDDFLKHIPKMLVGQNWAKYKQESRTFTEKLQQADTSLAMLHFIGIKTTQKCEQQLWITY